MVQLQLKFTSHDDRYTCAETIHTLPGKAERSQLNEIVKLHLQSHGKLDEISAAKVKFDFVIDNELLRTSLLDHVNEQNLSTENVLNVEFFEKQAAPKMKKEIKMNDWISCTRLSENYILLASFDGNVYVWDKKKGDYALVKACHCNGVNGASSVEWISCDGATDKNKAFFASGGFHVPDDLYLWEADLEKGEAKRVIHCKGHSDTVTAMTANDNNGMLATAGQDKMVCVYRSKPSADDRDKKAANDEDLSNAKRRKLEAKGYPRLPLAKLDGHQHLVSGVTWVGVNELASSSWDHTVKFWDVEQQRITTEIKASLALNWVEYSPLSKLTAAGASDRHIRLWDHRAADQKVVKSTLTSHHKEVKALKWSPNSEFHLVSCSYDNYVKTWDTRSLKTALHDISDHTDDIFTVDWYNNEIVSGGKDQHCYLYDVGQDKVTKVV